MTWHGSVAVAEYEEKDGGQQPAQRVGSTLICDPLRAELCECVEPISKSPLGRVAELMATSDAVAN